MSTPTEAQYQLAHEIRQSSYQEKAAQLIADSEARAVAQAIAKIIEKNAPEIAKINAEVERLLDENVKLNGYVDMHMKEKARAEKAEAEVVALGQFHDDNCRAVVQLVADAHTLERELTRLRAELSAAGIPCRKQKARK
jgi:uncharacterized membrane protein YheB (UPF0754 family)